MGVQINKNIIWDETIEPIVVETTRALDEKIRISPVSLWPVHVFRGTARKSQANPRHLRGIYYVPILVDDISAYISDSDQGRSNYKKFIEALDTDYPTVDMGQIEFYLKQAITTDPRKGDYLISQEAHVQKMLQNTDMSQCKSAPLPFNKGLFDQILKQGRAAPVDACW